MLTRILIASLREKYLGGAAAPSCQNQILGRAVVLPRRLLFVLATFALALLSHAENPKIEVHADKVLHEISPYLTGVCIEDVNHEIYGGLYSQMIFGESFQEPPPAPAVAGFRSYGGEWLVREGAVNINGADGPKLIKSDLTVRDATVSVEVFFANRRGDNAGLIVRTAEAGNGADAFSGYEISLIPAQRKVRLGRHRQNFELIQDADCEVPTGRWISLEARMNGPVIEVIVDGKSIIRHDDGANALLSGAVGLRAWRSQASCRRLRITQEGQVTSVPFVSSNDEPQISGMWRRVQSGSATGTELVVTNAPFTGSQSQEIIFEKGKGTLGIENEGLKRWGLGFVAGKTYEGGIWARAAKKTKLTVALESRDGSRIYDQKTLTVKRGGWQHLDFTMTPSGDESAGRFAITLTEPGAVTLGFASLQPAPWGRFADLPERRDVAEAMIGRGTKVVRYGGSMVNMDSYRWKNMIGARDKRPPYHGLWYRYSTDGWGIPDFMSFAEAAGFEYVPAFYMGEKPQDMADFVEYAKGPANSEWGKRRAQDGHPQPYKIHLMELGNEERVDMSYADKFEAMAAAIWAKDPNMILVVGDFAYTKPIVDPFHFTGADSHITTLAAQQRILKFAKEHNGEVWFDIHVNTERPEAVNNTLQGMFTFADALDKFADGAKHKVVVFELNAGNHAQKRALANAQAIMAIERDGRLPIVTSANGLQPDGQNDNDWDQGLIFLNPSKVWTQPPGYVMQMLSENYLPQVVDCNVTGGVAGLEAVATRSRDGKTLVLQVLNTTGQPITADIHLSGFDLTQQLGTRYELSGNPEEVNTAADPEHITLKKEAWKPDMDDGNTWSIFPPYSFKILRLE